MSTMTEGEVKHFLERFEALTNPQRGRVCWEFARLSWKRDGERPLWQRAIHALPFAWYALTYWLGIRDRRQAGEQPAPVHQVTAWGLLLCAGVAVLAGSAPAAVFLAVGSMAAWNWEGWLDTARQAGAGWPRR